MKGIKNNIPNNNAVIIEHISISNYLHILLTITFKLNDSNETGDKIPEYLKNSTAIQLIKTIGSNPKVSINDFVNK